MRLLIDNSAISLLHCKRRYQLAVVEGRRLPESKEISAGSAFHVVQEFIDKTGDAAAAVDTARARYPNTDMSQIVAASTLYRLTNKLPPPINVILNGVEVPAVEVKFKYHYGDFVHEQDPIHVDLCGTIDRIYIDPTPDMLVIQDYKASAAVTDGHRESIMSSYDLSFQLLFYLYALLNGGILPASYHDYITSGRYRLEYHFVFYAAKPPVFKRLVRTALPPDLVNREIPLIIDTKILEAVEIAKLSTPAPHDGMTVYGACKYCQFRPGCLNMGTERENEYVSRFDKSIYDPLTFR